MACLHTAEPKPSWIIFMHFDFSLNQIYKLLALLWNRPVVKMACALMESFIKMKSISVTKEFNLVSRRVEYAWLILFVYIGRIGTSA